MNFNLLSFKRYPYDSDFWPISLGDLSIILGARNGFSGNCRESCDRLFFLKLRFLKIRLLVTRLKCLFETKTNIGDINRSSGDDKEEGAEYKVKRIGNSEKCECSA